MMLVFTLSIAGRHGQSLRRGHTSCSYHKRPGHLTYIRAARLVGIRDIQKGCERVTTLSAGEGEVVVATAFLNVDNSSCG